MGNILREHKGFSYQYLIKNALNALNVNGEYTLYFGVNKSEID